MPDAIGISELGMINDMRLMEVISQNVANANTNGYKRELPVVRDFMTQLSVSMLESMQNNSLSEARSNEQSLVPGVKGMIDDAQGVLRFTGNPLDVAIEGEGFFEIDTAEGLRYTRRGSFNLDVNGRLVTPNGDLINGMDGEIRLLNPSPKIDKQGHFWDGEELLGQLKIVYFENTDALERANHGFFISKTQGQIVSDSVSGVRQGHVEASNVNVMDEMVRMMTTTRHFETTQRVITGYDQMIGEAISTIAEF